MERRRCKIKRDLQVDFNPSYRMSERIRRKKVEDALKVLEEIEYLTEDEWDRLRELFYKCLQRDYQTWLKEKGAIKS